MSTNIGEKIKRLRLALGESQEVFGERFGVEQATVSRWQKGSPVGRQYEQAIADLAGMTVGDFFHSPAQPKLTRLIGVASAGRVKFTPQTGERGEHVYLDLGGPDEIALKVQDNSMSPVYRTGDILIGRKLQGPDIAKAIGKDCIVRTNAGDGYVRILRASGKPGQYSLRAYNPTEDDVTDVHLDFAAPIIWIGRSQE
jgi:transcriptional regulator with XRE-family HTH domain